jgi:hypothetical protein
MGADSFTSNWQSKIFKQYGVSSMVMMMYANLFSSVRAVEWRAVEWRACRECGACRGVECVGTSVE